MEDEDPLLHVVWVGAKLAEIMQLMGAISWKSSSRRCTIGSGLMCVGPACITVPRDHHRAGRGAGHLSRSVIMPAHILLEPGEPGSGITVASALSENDLDRNWQRLILTHLTEREHLGARWRAAHRYQDDFGGWPRASGSPYRRRRLAKPPIVRFVRGLWKPELESVAGPRRRSRAVRTPRGRVTADCWNRGIGSGLEVPCRHDRPCHERHPAHGRQPSNPRSPMANTP